MIFLYLLFYAALLLYAAWSLPIGAVEAKILFLKSGWLHQLSFWLYSFYPSEIVVRLPQIVLSLVNIYLYYLLSLLYLKKPNQALFSAVLFSLLPAVIGAGVIVSEAPFVIFLTLLFLLLYFSYYPLAYPLALGMLFVDNAFSILFLALVLYTLYKRRFKELLFFLVLFLLSLMLYGFDVSGKPRTYFLDTFLLFSAIFSPLLFFYFFYVIYRILIKGSKDLVWFVSGVSFLFALALSFRQRIFLIDFAPFAVIGTLLMVKTFFHSLKVRLKRYRLKLWIAFWVVLASLVGSDLLLILHAPLFALFPSHTHFAYKNYFAKYLAKSLHQKKISCVDVSQPALQAQLRFYGIGMCPRALEFTPKGSYIISFRKRVLGRFNVSKGNNLE